jgi:hypothetical protein
MPLYKNRETGIVQFHPKGGIGDSINSDEVDETSKPVKPRAPLGTGKKEVARRRSLQKPRTPRAPKTPDATSDGSANQKGAD